jgi:endonuclease III
MVGFVPQRSPYSLLQEDLHGQPFWLLVGCCLLNLTRRQQAELVLRQLMERWPTPEALLEADDDELLVLLKPLGLCNRRARTLKRMSAAVILGAELPNIPGVGEYARRSHSIFCMDDLGTVEPHDGALSQYWRWRTSRGRGT